jgi:ligand-binding sensor domain-containing protein
VNAPAVARVYTTQDGLAGNFINSLFQAADGRLWVGTRSGLSVSLSDTCKGAMRFRGYTNAHGLSSSGVGSMAEDRDGNLWLGAESGAMKIGHNGFTTYDEADGLGATRIGTLLINRAGELCAIGASENRRIIHRFDGRRFEAVELRLPGGITSWGWGWHQTMFQARLGERQGE